MSDKKKIVLPTATVDKNYDHLTRQMEILPTKFLNQPITIIGAGAIGSWTALALVKAGFEDVTIYDFDTIEIENMNAQFFRVGDIKKAKVVALQELIRDFTGVTINAKNERFANQVLNGIVISAVDSMDARAQIWASCKINPSVRMVIDPRMSAETAAIYTMKPHLAADIESYEKTLYTDGEAVAERCTAKSTIFCVNIISGFVVKAVKDVVTENSYTRVGHLDIKANEYSTFHSPEIKKA